MRPNILDSKWTYIPAASHDADSTAFRERQRQRMEEAQRGLGNVELVKLERREVVPIRRKK